MLDTNARSLLQVKVKEIDEASDIFAKLMGDEDELRRDFIEENALAATATWPLLRTQQGATALLRHPDLWMQRLRTFASRTESSRYPRAT